MIVSGFLEVVSVILHVKMFGVVRYFVNLRCMATLSSFSAMFSKRDNFRDFLFAYLEDKVFLKLGLFLKERICSDGSKFSPL